MSSLLTEENQSDIKYHHCCQKENQSDIKGLLPAVVLRVIKLSKDHLPSLEGAKSQHCSHFKGKLFPEKNIIQFSLRGGTAGFHWSLTPKK